VQQQLAVMNGLSLAASPAGTEGSAARSGAAPRSGGRQGNGESAVTEAEIYRELTALFHDIFDDETITLSPSMTAEDVDGWDSFTHVNLIVAAEQRFGIKFGTAELESMKNVGELARLIGRKLGNVTVGA
jgi:acyl carrier protein